MRACTRGNLYSLTEAYEKAGQRDEAIRHYRRSLQPEPKNANAIERLKALGAPPATKAAAPWPQRHKPARIVADPVGAG